MLKTSKCMKCVSVGGHMGDEDIVNRMKTKTSGNRQSVNSDYRGTL